MGTTVYSSKRTRQQLKLILSVTQKARKFHQNKTSLNETQEDQDTHTLVRWYKYSAMIIACCFVYDNQPIILIMKERNFLVLWLLLLVLKKVQDLLWKNCRQLIIKVIIVHFGWRLSDLNLFFTSWQCKVFFNLQPILWSYGCYSLGCIFFLILFVYIFVMKFM